MDSNVEITTKVKVIPDNMVSTCTNENLGKSINNKETKFSECEDEKQGSSHKIYESESKSIKYMFFHSVIRNDDHCPICRRYYISLHSTMNDALAFSSVSLEDESDICALKTNKPVWVDEWVRRNNVDKYQIIELVKNKIYNLRNYNIDSGESNDSDNNDTRYSLGGFNYMLLHIHINKENWCPDNINFKISFYETAIDAFKNGLSLMGKCTDTTKDKFRCFKP